MPGGLLNPFNFGILSKIDIKKKKKKPNLNEHIEKTRTNSSQNSDFLKVHSVFFKTALFSARCTHVDTRQGVKTSPHLLLRSTQCYLFFSLKLLNEHIIYTH